MVFMKEVLVRDGRRRNASTYLVQWVEQGSLPIGPERSYPTSDD